MPPEKMHPDLRRFLDAAQAVIAGFRLNRAASPADLEKMSEIAVAHVNDPDEALGYMIVAHIAIKEHNQLLDAESLDDLGGVAVAFNELVYLANKKVGLAE